MTRLPKNYKRMLCSHWERTDGVRCPSQSKGCGFAHSLIELRCYHNILYNQQKLHTFTLEELQIELEKSLSNNNEKLSTRLNTPSKVNENNPPTTSNTPPQPLYSNSLSTPPKLSATPPPPITTSVTSSDSLDYKTTTRRFY